MYCIPLTIPHNYYRVAPNIRTQMTFPANEASINDSVFEVIESIDAASSSSDFAFELFAKTGDEVKCWDLADGYFPFHGTNRLMPDETDGNYIRVTIGNTFTAYYDVSAYSSSVATFTASTMFDYEPTNGPGTWAAASSLTCAAAFVVAASLF